MEINWTTPTKLFIADTRTQKFREKPDLEADLRTCVDLARGWDDGVNFQLDVVSPVLGKTTLLRQDLELLPRTD